VFLYTKDTNGSTLTIHLPAGSYVSTYTAASAWNVTQNTVAEGNQTKYGNNHKAINIVVDDT
jgi:hypothetical protein